MITPRQIRLIRRPTLAAFRTTLVRSIRSLDLDTVRDTCVLVPTRAAAEQMRRTLEEHDLSQPGAAVLWPVFVTRRDLYDELASRLPSTPRLLSAFEREVLLGAVCRAVRAEGLELPYELRPALIAEMLALYDHIRRLGRTIEDFERNFHSELEKEQDTDRGAARLLQQTAYLAAVYRGYEARLLANEWQDEHVLRELLMREVPARPVRRVVVTVADRLADPDGTWPADLDLLSRVPGLERIELMSTEGVLASGYLERLYAAFPDLGEERWQGDDRAAPALIAPAPAAPGERDPICFTYRDREEELIGVARRLKQDRRDGTAAALHRTAIVVRRPLPYLYLARSVFADSGVPFEALDTMPLAAEPYAAAVDLVLEAVTSDFTRGALMALLRSPHFSIATADDTALRDCDHALAEARYLGGVDRLERLVAAWAADGEPGSREERRRQNALPALQPLYVAARALQPLARSAPLVAQISTLLQWLRRYDRAEQPDDDVRSRRLRVRSAVLGALATLRDAYERHDPEAEGDASVVLAAVRRWLGSQTFASQSGVPGLQILDAQAARFAELDDMQIVGLVEGEWPERTRRNVLYPSSLLALLEPLPAIADPSQRERDLLKSARAQFRDLLLSPRMHVRMSTFALENDAVVEPSVLLDDVPALGLSVRPQVVESVRVSCTEALAFEPQRGDVLPSESAAWARARLTADTRDAERLRGRAGTWRMPRVSISRLELYLNCPFKFFAAQVLKLEEQPEDEAIQTPLERGRFLHELWERFFDEWQRRGHGRIDPDHFEEARRLFAEIAEQALATLSPAEAALERQRLLGSAVDPGIAHRVFAMEASRPTPIVERLLEFPLEGEFPFHARTGELRVVTLNAKTDRIDVLEGGAIRVIDYKSKNTPDTKVALQLPIYSRLAQDVLLRERRARFALAEALYLSFEGNKAVVPLRAPRGQTLEDLIADAEDRALKALDRIADGDFPPQPSKKSLCGPCSYRAVCRLEIVEPAQEAAQEPADG